MANNCSYMTWGTPNSPDISPVKQQPREVPCQSRKWFRAISRWLHVVAYQWAFIPNGETFMGGLNCNTAPSDNICNHLCGIKANAKLRERWSIYSPTSTTSFYLDMKAVETASTPKLLDIHGYMVYHHYTVTSHKSSSLHMLRNSIYHRAFRTTGVWDKNMFSCIHLPAVITHSSVFTAHFSTSTWCVNHSQTKTHTCKSVK